MKNLIVPTSLHILSSTSAVHRPKFVFPFEASEILQRNQSNKQRVPLSANSKIQNKIHEKHNEMGAAAQLVS